MSDPRVDLGQQRIGRVVEALNASNPAGPPLTPAEIVTLRALIERADPRIPMLMIGSEGGDFDLLHILTTCAQAADHLEHGMGWDGHGWETVRTAVRAAASLIRGSLPSDEDLGPGPATPAVEALRGHEFGHSRALTTHPIN